MTRRTPRKSRRPQTTATTTAPVTPPAAIPFAMTDDADYRAVRRACRKPDDIVLLASAIRKGWTGAALRAYAWLLWHGGPVGHVTPETYRIALGLIIDWGMDSPEPGRRDDPRPFLERFNADAAGPLGPSGSPLPAAI